MNYVDVYNVDTVNLALGMQTQSIRDCQLTASESPVTGQQAQHARLGGPSGRHIFANTICVLTTTNRVRVNTVRAIRCCMGARRGR